MRYRLLILFFLVLLIVRLRLPAESFVKASSDHPKSVAVVELFTSEGCSSCPPADALLGKIHLKQTSAGQLIVGISEHVTYWDRLGWKDPYSDEAFTDRQTTYADRLRVAEPYTPQMVLNGRRQFVGSDTSALEKALNDDAHQKHLELHIVSSAIDHDGISLKFSVNGTTSQPVDVIAVITDDADESNVLRGENSGRSLRHVSVARTLVRIASVNGDGEQSVHLPLSANLHLGGGPGHHVVVFAQERNQGSIVGADTVPI
jgi:hypothetical protein